MKIFTLERRTSGYIAYYFTVAGCLEGREMDGTDPAQIVDEFKVNHPDYRYVDDGIFERYRVKIEAERQKLAAWNGWIK